MTCTTRLLAQYFTTLPCERTYIRRTQRLFLLMLSTLRINATKINMSIRKATKFGFLVPVLFTAIISSVPMSLVKKKKKMQK